MVNIQQKRHSVRRVLALAERLGVKVEHIDYALGQVVIHHQGLECRVLAIRGSDGYCRTRWNTLAQQVEEQKRWQIHSATSLFGAGGTKPFATSELLMRGLEQQLEWLQKNPYSLPQAA